MEIISEGLLLVCVIQMPTTSKFGKSSKYHAYVKVMRKWILTLYQTTSDLLKLEVFADDKIKVTKKFKFISGREENIVSKG